MIVQEAHVIIKHSFQSVFRAHLRNGIDYCLMLTTTCKDVIDIVCEMAPSLPPVRILWYLIQPPSGLPGNYKTTRVIGQMLVLVRLYI